MELSLCATEAVVSRADTTQDPGRYLRRRKVNMHRLDTASLRLPVTVVKR